MNRGLENGRMRGMRRGSLGRSSPTLQGSPALGRGMQARGSPQGPGPNRGSPVRGIARRPMTRRPF
jgi:hypothetical protein